MAERSLLRIGSICGALGALFALGANALYPRPEEWERREVLLQLIADTETGRWVGVHVGITFGALLILACLAALARTLTGETPVALARLGLLAGGVGTGLWVLLGATDAATMKALADAWAKAPEVEKAATFRVADAVAMLNGAIFTAAITVGLGLTFLLMGLAVALDDAWPRWLGWIAAAGGALELVVGVVQAYRGADVLLTNVVFPLGALALTLWVVEVSALLWRRGTPGVIEVPTSVEI